MDSALATIEKKYICGSAEYSTLNNGEGCTGDIAVLSFLEDGNQYILDCLTSTDSMAAIAEEWKHLEQNCPEPPEPYIYFQSYDWCAQWCNTYIRPGENGTAVKIYILRRNGKLVMVWPMILTKQRAGIATLTFLTEPHGQYGNIICDTRHVSLEIGRRIWKHITSTCNADAITLDQYPKSSYFNQIIGTHGLLENSNKHASVLDLEAFSSWEEYHASLSRNQRKQRNRRRKKIARLGELEFNVYYGDSERYRELVDLALQWKTKWLHETARHATVLSQASTKAFLSALPGSQANAGEFPQGAVLGALTLNGEPIGIEIGMCLNGHYYSYLGAFDWQRRNLSPGKIQIEEAQVWAKEIGLRKFDFLGDPADYKTAWTNTTDTLQSRSIPLSLRGFFYCYFWKAYLRPAARVFFNKVSAEKRAKILKLLGMLDTLR